MVHDDTRCDQFLDGIPLLVVMESICYSTSTQLHMFCQIHIICSGWQKPLTGTLPPKCWKKKNLFSLLFTDQCTLYNNHETVFLFQHISFKIFLKIKTMAKILVDYHITPTCFGLGSPSSGSYFLCLVEICLYNSLKMDFQVRNMLE
jgi:hypothetical protein